MSKGGGYKRKPQRTLFISKPQTLTLFPSLILESYLLLTQETDCLITNLKHCYLQV